MSRRRTKRDPPPLVSRTHAVTPVASADGVQASSDCMAVACASSGARSSGHSAHLARQSLCACDPTGRSHGGRALRVAAIPQPLAVAATLSVLLALSSGGCSDVDDSPRTPASSLANFRKTLETVGIEFVSINSAFEFHNPDGGLTTGKPVDPRDLERYLPLFVREFSIYPKEFLKRSGLKRIILCTDMRYSGRECAGLAQYDPPAMYLDVSEPPEDARIQCLAIHHEFFHLVDFAGDGIVGEDDGWSSLNPPGFRYNPKLGSGGDGAVVERTGALRGFLAAQSLDNVAEDKAVVFAELIVNGPFVVKRAEQDPWLQAKVIAMKRALAEFCTKIDEKFWEAASRTERPAPEPVIGTDDLGGTDVQ